MSKPLRQSMPTVSAFIDECREAFGAEMVNDMIKLGMQGAETFYASENGIEVGTKFREPTRFITADTMVIQSKEDRPAKFRRRL